MGFEERFGGFGRGRVGGLMGGNGSRSRKGERGKVRG